MRKHRFNIFPEMNKEEYKLLLNDIKTNGYDKSQPIWLYEGEIIDGWNRFRVCNELGIKPEIENFEGDDFEAIQFVMRTNKRRNLNSSQWAVIAIKSEEVINTVKIKLNEERKKKIAESMKNNQNRSGEKSTPSENVVYEGNKKPQDVATKTADILAEMFNTNNKYIKQANQIKELKPEALAEIESGQKTINDVKREIKIEQSKQAVLKQIDFGAENKVVNLDAISFLKTLPNNSVNMVLTDPPFGIDYEDTRDVGNEKFNDGEEETMELLEEVCEELYRVCKENTHLYFFSGYTHLQKFKDIIGKYFLVQDNPLIWVKNNHTMTDFTKKYANKYEFIIFAKKGDGRLLNNKISTDILEFAKPTNKIHSCEKPIDLLQYLIENSSQKGEVVLDPFGGSLSTYRASVEIERKCWTCELDEIIYKKSVNNL